MKIFHKAHQWISGLLVDGELGIDGLMHMLNIHHMEGWWIPVVGGGAVATGANAWIRSWRKPRCGHAEQAPQETENTKEAAHDDDRPAA